MLRGLTCRAVRHLRARQAPFLDSHRARDCSCLGLLYRSDRRRGRISERNTHLRRGYTPWTFHPQPIRQNLRGRSAGNFLQLEAAQEEVAPVVGDGHDGGFRISRGRR